MRKVSLRTARIDLSRIVDEAELQGKRTVIVRGGKPVAAIVPVEAAKRPRRLPRSPMNAAASARSVRRFIREFSAADSGTSAVADLTRGRR